MMDYDGLWWIMMDYDGLWWIMMDYDGWCSHKSIYLIANYVVRGVTDFSATDMRQVPLAGWCFNRFNQWMPKVGEPLIFVYGGWTSTTSYFDVWIVSSHFQAFQHVSGPGCEWWSCRKRAGGESFDCFELLVTTEFPEVKRPAVFILKIFAPGKCP